VQRLWNVVYWEEKWHWEHYNFEFPVVGLVDYRRVLQLGKSEVSSTIAVREQRMLASEAIPWRVVDEKGNPYALNPDSGLFEQTGIVEDPNRQWEVEKDDEKSSAALVLPKTMPTRFPRTRFPQTTVDVEFPDLYWKLHAFRYLDEGDNDKDQIVCSWAINQLEVWHPFMYQALVAERFAFSVEDLFIYGDRRPESKWCKLPENTRFIAPVGLRIHEVEQ
jgi:hypothetical protein